MQQVSPLPGHPIPVMDTMTTFTVAEVQVVMGQTRILVSPPIDGNRYQMGYSIEWITSLSMSPQTAKHLLRQLTDTVEQYEAKFGTIQHDPAAEPKSASVTPLRIVPAPEVTGSGPNGLSPPPASPAEPELPPPAA